MPNPVEILGRARDRIAQVAAIRAGAYAIAPALAAAALALCVAPIGRVTWTRFGYILAPGRATILRDAFFLIAAGALLAGAAMALRAYRRALNFVAAAEQIDNAVRARQEILTFATLANPELGDSAKATRSPLFPILWRRAIGLLERFDPTTAFPLALGRPLARSSILAGAVALAMLLATMGLVRPPTREQAMAERLREIAREIDASSSAGTDREIADAAIAAADALENNKIPPEQKIKKLDDAMHALQQEKKGAGGANKGVGAGGGKQAAKGHGNGSGQGGSGGKGNGAGGSDKSGQPGQGSGGGKSQQSSNSGAGGKQGKQSKDPATDLKNELADAKAQLESDATKSPKNKDNKLADDNRPGNAPKTGGKPDQKGAASKPDSSRPGKVPKGIAGKQNVPPTGGSQAHTKDMGSNLGDTHLGETPPAANYQRYLKPGEKGAALDIHDARYVMFRLPNSAVVGGGGKTVADTNRPTATTAYVNAPLKETADQSTPDERQLVPPRYRDLIH